MTITTLMNLIEISDNISAIRDSYSLNSRALMVKNDAQGSVLYVDDENCI